MARSKSSSCLIGCGIGCLLLVILGIALLAGGTFFVRDTMSGFDDAVENRVEIEERFGEPREFTPAADGSVAAVRIEAFLAIRESTQEPRGRIIAFFDSLPMSEAEAREIEDSPFFEKIGTVMGITGSAIGFGAAIGDFFATRNQAFIDHDMGLGEYAYIYALAYYSWLGKSPADGPGDEAEMRGDFSDNYRRVRRNLIAQLTNLRDSLPEAGAEAAPQGWRAAVTAEIEALDGDRHRVPWEGELPEPIVASFRPYRERLEAAYEPVTNPFELGRTERRGRFSIDVD